jgi:ubiquinone/menaquinone biosynthesis C-methylase UbiE
MSFKRIFDLLDVPAPQPKVIDGIFDFVPSADPHKAIGEAYDKSIVIYDDYMQSKKLHLRILKRILLGMGKEDTDECTKITRKFIDLVGSGIVLDIPCGTGVFTFEEYAKARNITFIAADYSLGMLKEANKRVKDLGAQNIILVRADVGALPFKNQVFDGVLTLNGIHSFPDKAKAIKELGRVLKHDRGLFGSLCVKRERWLTDIMMELFYFPGKWFTRPALSRREFLGILEANGLKNIKHRLIGPGLLFESLK